LSPANGTGDAGVAFVDDLKRSGSLLALVFQLSFEHAPAGVEHRLCHPCLDQLETAHVAHDYLLIAINNFPRKLMQGIGPAPRSFAMNTFGLPLVAMPLS
jgi:hypothetical protein